MYIEKRVTEFIDELASKASMPGGGSAAALAGASGAALVSMVANLTLGKEKYQDVQADIEQVLAKSEALRHELLNLLEEDTKAYLKMMATYRLPKGTEEEIKARSAAIQESLKGACEVPFAIARCCADVVDLCGPIVEKGNVSAVSDGGVGILLAQAALHSALMNVKINLKSIKDTAYVQEAQARMDNLTRGKDAVEEKVLMEVERKL